MLLSTVSSYGKPKDTFGWPEESDEVPTNTVVPTQTGTGTNVDVDNASNSPPPITSLDK